MSASRWDDLRLALSLSIGSRWCRLLGVVDGLCHALPVPDRLFERLCDAYDERLVR